jgi:hypothetical protein
MENKLDYQNRDDAKKEVGFLRSLFGTSRSELWMQLAEQIGADFVKGGFFREDAVVATVGQWTITLDTWTIPAPGGSTTFTRMRAPYVNRDGFQFLIYRAGDRTWNRHFLRLPVIKIGDPQFDGAFVYRSSSEQKGLDLLSSTQIRVLINAQRRIRICVKDDEGWFKKHFPQGVDELHFESEEVIKDIDRLRNLFELFAEILHQLCHIGSAYENDPGVRLKAASSI